MKHIFVLLFEDTVPRVIRNSGEFTADSMVPHLPASAGKHRVGCWDRAKLEFRVWWKCLRRQNLVRRSLFVWMILPFDKACAYHVSIGATDRDVYTNASCLR